MECSSVAEAVSAVAALVGLGQLPLARFQQECRRRVLAAAVVVAAEAVVAVAVPRAAAVVGAGDADLLFMTMASDG